MYYMVALDKRRIILFRCCSHLKMHFDSQIHEGIQVFNVETDKFLHLKRKKIIKYRN